MSLVYIYQLDSKAMRHPLNSNDSSDTSLFTLCSGLKSKRV